MAAHVCEWLLEVSWALVHPDEPGRPAAAAAAAAGGGGEAPGGECTGAAAVADEDQDASLETAGAAERFRYFAGRAARIKLWGYYGLWGRWAAAAPQAGARSSAGAHVRGRRDVRWGGYVCV